MQPFLTIVTSKDPTNSLSKSAFKLFLSSDKVLDSHDVIYSVPLFDWMISRSLSSTAAFLICYIRINNHLDFR